MSDPDRLGGDGDDRVLPPPTQPMAVATEMVTTMLSTPEGDHRVRHWRGSFWEWVTTHWAELPEPALKSAAYRFTEHATWEKVSALGIATVMPWAPTRHKIDDVVDALRAITHLRDVEMPAWIASRDSTRSRPLGAMYRADHYVSCTNGLLHVPTRELHPHSPHYWNRVSVPFDFDPHPAQPVRWLAFLEELWPDDPDAIAALRQFFGYVISGRTDLHKIMLLIGPTRAGKGVIARILKALVGRGNYAGPTLASLGTNFGLQPLIGKPLAIVSDARLGDSNINVVVERLLSVSGEDMLTVDVKFKEPWTGTLPTRFLILSNELPRFGDASGAIANRFVVLTLRRSWLGREDTTLTDKLAEELPGILGWALDGLDELRSQGRFTEPRSSIDAIMALADLVSPASAFVRDRCVTGPGHEVPVKALYGSWKEWALDNGHHAGSTHTFGRNLRAVVPALRVTQIRQGDDRERVYQGIALSTGYPNGPDRVPARDNPPDEPVERGLSRDVTRSSPLQVHIDEPPADVGGDRAVDDPPVCFRCDHALVNAGSRWVCTNGPGHARRNGSVSDVEDDYPASAWGDA